MECGTPGAVSGICTFGFRCAPIWGACGVGVLLDLLDELDLLGVLREDEYLDEVRLRAA